MANINPRPHGSCPAVGSLAPTLADSGTQTGAPFYGFWVSVTGNVKMTMLDGSTPTFSNMPVGFYPFAGNLIWSTGTTATVERILF